MGYELPVHEHSATPYNRGPGYPTNFFINFNPKPTPDPNTNPELNSKPNPEPNHNPRQIFRCLIHKKKVISRSLSADDKLLQEVYVPRAIDQISVSRGDIT